MYQTAVASVKKHNLLEKGDHVIIGLSGGADSVALFHFLRLLRDDYALKLTAAHVNHGLRDAESDGDEDFCRRLCEKFEINFISYSADVQGESEKTGVSLEEAGRICRYRVFYETLAKAGANKIALGHNKNDNAETIIMRLLRGTGVAGLAGIPVRRSEIIRPLLNVSRAEIEEYCRTNSFDYRTDSSNNETAFTRNKIRLGLMPYIESEINESVVSTLAVSAETAAIENNFLNSLALKAFIECVCPEKTGKDSLALSSSSLKNLDEAVARRVLRLAYERFTGSLKDLSAVHVNAAYALLSKQTGKTAQLPGGVEAESSYGRIVFRRKLEAPPEFCRSISPGDEIFVSGLNLIITADFLQNQNIITEEKSKNVYTISIDYDKIKNGLFVRSRLPGDKIFIRGAGRRKIKDFLIGLKIDRREREDLFYIAEGKTENGVSGGEIVAVLSRGGAVRISDRYSAAVGISTLIIRFWEAADYDRKNHYFDFKRSNREES